MGDYPIGAADDPRAPYNEVALEPTKVDACVSITLSKDTTLTIEDYRSTEEITSERDEEGYPIKTKSIIYDFSDSDFKGAYESQEYTIPELLEILKKYVQSTINGGFYIEDIEKAKQILKACNGWTVDELEVINNN